MALRHSLYVYIASTPTDQPCDHDKLLRQSKVSCDSCVATTVTMYICNRTTDV